MTFAPREEFVAPIALSTALPRLLIASVTALAPAPKATLKLPRVKLKLKNMLFLSACKDMVSSRFGYDFFEYFSLVKLGLMAEAKAYTTE